MNPQAKKYWDIEEGIREFESRRGWTLEKTVDDRRPLTTADTTRQAIKYTGKRVFDYPGNAGAMLWFEAHGDAYRFLWTIIEAHISLPFSAGPEETFSVSRAKKPVQGLVEWVAERERMLSIPLEIAQAKTLNQACELANSKGGKGLWWLSVIFDLDDGLAKSVLVDKLVRICNPKLVKEFRGV